MILLRTSIKLLLAMIYASNTTCLQYGQSSESGLVRGHLQWKESQVQALLHRIQKGPRTCAEIATLLHRVGWSPPHKLVKVCTKAPDSVKAGFQKRRDTADRAKSGKRKLQEEP